MTRHAASARAAGLIAVVHPFPSALNAVVVLVLVLFAGGGVARALVLALAMLLIEFAIGAANDWFDVELDATTKPSKPIPAGLIGRRDAAVVATVAGALGLALAALSSGLSLWGPAAFGAVLLGTGLAYDAYLKRTPLSWLCFSAAFALVLLFAWTSVPGYYPVAPWTVIVVALIAGPALQLANAVVDLERDRSFGLRTLPVVIGRRGTTVLLAALQLTIQAILWATLRTFAWAPAAVVALIAAGSVMSLGGVAASAAAPPRVRAVGWSVQALGLAVLTIGWTMLREPAESQAG